MNNLVVIESVGSWGQRNEPDRGEFIATLDGNQWRSLITSGVGEHPMTIDTISYQGCIKRGVYLGNNLVAAVRMRPK